MHARHQLFGFQNRDGLKDIVMASRISFNSNSCLDVTVDPLRDLLTLNDTGVILRPQSGFGIVGL